MEVRHDFLGQEVSVGDYAVLIEGGHANLCYGIVTKFTPNNVRIKYITKRTDGKYTKATDKVVQTCQYVKLSDEQAIMLKLKGLL